MKKFLIIFSVLFFFSFVFFGNSGLAESAFDTNLKNTATETGHVDSSGGGKSIDQVIQAVISTVLSFLGVGFLILMIYGGYVWMIARGNEQEVTKAKSIITNAIIGLIVVLSAYAISYFVVSSFGAGDSSDSGGSGYTQEELDYLNNGY